MQLDGGRLRVTIRVRVKVTVLRDNNRRFHSATIFRIILIRKLEHGDTSKDMNCKHEADDILISNRYTCIDITDIISKHH